MKSPRFLPSAAAVMLALGLLPGPAPVRADEAADAKRRAAAEEFLTVRKTEDLVNNAARQMAENIDRISDGVARQANASVNQADLLQKMRAEARGMISKELNWEKVRPGFVQAYSQAFTEAELREMTAFYKTPAGQKLVTVDPEVIGQMQKVSQEKAMAVLPRIVQRLREMVAAVNPPGSAPPLLAPPLPPGMAAPPAPPPGMIPPPAPPAMNPPAMTPPAPAPNGTPSVHPAGKTEPGNR